MVIRVDHVASYFEYLLTSASNKISIQKYLTPGIIVFKRTALNTLRN